MELTRTTVLLEQLGHLTNRKAWDQFVARFREPIVGFARKLGLSDVDAEDAAQETLAAFVKAFRRGQYDRSKGRLDRWLFGIAYHQVMSLHRKRAACEAQPPERGSATSFLSALPDEQQASASWDEEWEQALMARCIEQVRGEVGRQKFRAFEMVVLRERPAAEVARKLGMTRNAVYIAKHRVLARIRELRQAYEEVR